MTAPAPVVTGISPNEATPGTKITIRGENFGLISSDIIGINILGKLVWFDLRSFEENENVLALKYDNHCRPYRKCQFISSSGFQQSPRFWGNHGWVHTPFCYRKLYSIVFLNLLLMLIILFFILFNMHLMLTKFSNLIKPNNKHFFNKKVY